MSPAPPTLHMMRGKIAAGKSTLTARPGNADETVVAAKDAWLDHLYSDRMSSVADYVRCSAKLRQVWGPHIAALLNAGISVVLGFPANTIETRTWMRDIPEQTTAAHALHVLDVPDAVCLARPQRPQRTGLAATEEQFRRIAKHFVAPSPDEGFNIVVHTAESIL